MASTSLDLEDIQWGLQELARRLDAAGVTALFVIVGGAAMMLEHDTERGTTSDIDTRIGPFRANEPVKKVVDEIAVERGWGSDWLNSKAMTAGFFPEDSTEDDAHVIFQHGNVIIRVANPRLLFVMKLHAARPARDWPDLAVLAEVCDIRTRTDAVELYEARYPEWPLKPDAQRWLDLHYGEN